MTWKPIPGHTGYEASEDGRIRYSSDTRMHVLRPATTERGYKHVCIGCDGRGRKTCLVHRLVAKAFIPNPNHKPQVNHRDGDPGNNSVSNLEWVSQRENMNHAYATGLMKWGQDGPGAVLTDEQIQEVLKERKAGSKLAALAAKYGSSVSEMSLVCNGYRTTFKTIGAYHTHRRALIAKRGKRTRVCYYPDEKVREIRRLLSEGINQRQAAIRVGVRPGFVWLLTKGHRSEVV